MVSKQILMEDYINLDYKEFDNLTLESCSYCNITNCRINHLRLINCQRCSIHGNYIGKIEISNNPPVFTGIFKKLKTHKWINKYGSKENTIFCNIQK